MDYEKKYKQLHKFISDLYPFMSEYCKEKVEGFLPEFKESEDEKIRKFLIKWIQDNYYHGTTEIPTKTLIACLERQGGEKPSIEMITPEESLGIDSETYNKIVDECIYGDDKQNPAWSEENEHRVKDTIYFLDTAKKHYASTVELDACINWLKSIKERIGGE